MGVDEGGGGGGCIIICKQWTRTVFREVLVWHLLNHVTIVAIMLFLSRTVLHAEPAQWEMPEFIVQ